MKTIPLVSIDLATPPKERWKVMPSALISSGTRLAQQQRAGIPFAGAIGFGLRMITKIVNPYRDDIKALAKLFGVDTGTLLGSNFVYEMSMAFHVREEKLEALSETHPGIAEKVKRLLNIGCTSGAVCGKGTGLLHLRSLDWSFPKLGFHNTVFHMRNAPAGDYYNIGFPGFVGVLTGIAPGRFSASINYAAPVDMPSLAWPPTHLLRYVFEQCKTYEEALETLEGSHTGTPALITLVGTKRNEAAIVECTAGDNIAHEMTRSQPIAIANDYLSGELREQRNGLSSEDVKPHEQAEEQDIFAEDRRNTLLSRLNEGTGKTLESAAQLLNAYPVLNEETKLQIVMAPHNGSMILYGVENEKRVAHLEIKGSISRKNPQPDKPKDALSKHVQTTLKCTPQKAQKTIKAVKEGIIAVLLSKRSCKIKDFGIFTTVSRYRSGINSRTQRKESTLVKSVKFTPYSSFKKQVEIEF